jgi:hypothetical protein
MPQILINNRPVEMRFISNVWVPKLSSLAKHYRLAMGKLIERRVVEVHAKREIQKGHKIDLRFTEKKEEFTGIDVGISTDGAPEELFQAKAREPGFADLTFEICEHYYRKLSDLDQYPGREIRGSSYDKFVCLVWQQNAKIIVVTSAETRRLLKKTIEEFTTAFNDRSLRWSTMTKTPTWTAECGAQVKMVEDREDKHIKLVAYIPENLFEERITIDCTPEELNFIYDLKGLEEAANG